MLNKSTAAVCIGRVRRGLRLLAICGTSGALAACVQAPKDMYSWQAYQPSVYAYLQDDGADYAAQAKALEQNIEVARSSSAVLPPGFRAHLGLLYLKMGEDNKAVEQFESEKIAFPEASPFVDFLLRNASALKTQAKEPSSVESLEGAPAPGQPASPPATKHGA